MTILDDVKRAMELIEASRRTVVCSPENVERVQAAVDASGVGGLYEVQASRFLPSPDMVLLVDTRPRPFVITDLTSGGAA
jgi:hypothetical protein